MSPQKSRIESPTIMHISFFIYLHQNCAIRSVIPLLSAENIHKQKLGNHECDDQPDVESETRKCQTLI